MSNPGFRIYTEIQRPAAQLVAELGRYPTANIGDCVGRFYCVGGVIRPFNRPGTRMAGVAVTVKSPPGDNLMLHKAVDMIQPGDVIVCDAGGDCTRSLIGELMCLWAVRRGLGGLVVDGCIRDSDTLVGMDLPVYARGAHPGGPYKDGLGEINVPVTLAGVVVYPGDIAVGDDDGVVVVPRADAAAVLARVRPFHDKEQDIKGQIAAGAWDRSWVDRTLREKGCQVIQGLYPGGR